MKSVRTFSLPLLVALIVAPPSSSTTTWMVQAFVGQPMVGGRLADIGWSVLVPMETLSSPRMPTVPSTNTARSSLTKLQSSDPLESDDKDLTAAGGVGVGTISLAERIFATFSTVAASKVAKKYGIDFNPASEKGLNLLTLLRVGIPAALSGLFAFMAFPAMSLWLCTLFSDAAVFTVLSTDSSQFVQNFLTVAGLLFSILVGQTYYFMYQQQESLYYALFNEVTEAKSLLEQVALVCQGRSMYPKVLASIQKYVQNDLKNLQADPAVLLSARPMDDPLETIMYLTSVGVPSTVYETVRSLRQARAQRLGALQRKLPQVHMLLLWLLAAIELVSFPLLGAGTQTLGGYKILTIEGCLFGVMTFGIVMTLRIVGELWRPAGGAYNVDNVLKIMVRGLEHELQARLDGKKIDIMSGVYPSPATIDAEFIKRADKRIASANLQTPGTMDEIEQTESIKHQGADISIPFRRVLCWVAGRREGRQKNKLVKVEENQRRS